MKTFRQFRSEINKIRSTSKMLKTKEHAKELTAQEKQEKQDNALIKRRANRRQKYLDFKP